MNQKLTTIHEALETLKESIELFREYEKIASDEPTRRNEQLFLGMRDSMIQRFEYCTDLFWKLLKVYLEEVEKVDIPTLSPRGVVRETVKVKTITESEGKECMEMVKSRNETSHIYHEEIAEAIAQKVPEFYQLITMIVGRVKEKLVLK